MENLYGDTRRDTIVKSNPQVNEPTSNEHVIGFDLSSNLTLKQAIDIFKRETDHLPDDTPLLVYFVCGHDFNFKDLVYFMEYIDACSFKNIFIKYRGVVNAETFMLLFDNRVKFTENSVLMYKPTELYKYYNLLKYVGNNAFDKFMSKVVNCTQSHEILIDKFDF